MTDHPHVACPSCGYEGSLTTSDDVESRTCPRCHKVLGEQGGESTVVVDPVRLSAMVFELWKNLLGSTDDPRESIRPTNWVPEAESRARVKRHQIGKQSAEGESQDFELVKLLGMGGMGVVYSARQASVDRLVALKMLKGPLAHDPMMRGKFLTEALVTGDLDHPNIVPIVDLGQAPDGSLFYAMKQVEGKTWFSVIKEKSLAENLEILLRVSDAVAFAHSRGVIHRDLKPGNVMLGAFGEVLVMDWGLAAASGDTGKAERLNRNSARGGTPAYMAPEIALCEVEMIGPASDIYLLGAILFEILTGESPHPGTSVETTLGAAAANVIRETAERGELMAIARQAMSTQPADRHADVQSLQAAVRDYQEHAASLRLSASARDDLAQGRRDQDYESFARSISGYQDALRLWKANPPAAVELNEARMAYATCACERGDFDLCISVLDPGEAAHQPLLKRAKRARQIALTRRHQLRLSIATLILVLLASTIWIFVERSHALVARDQAVAAQQAEAAEYYANLIALAASRAETPEYPEVDELLEASSPEARHWEWGYLKKRTAITEFPLVGGWRVAGKSARAAFSPDGQYLAVACQKPRAGVVIWRLDTGQVVGFLAEKEHGEVRRLQFMPNGEALALAMVPGELLVYDLKLQAIRWTRQEEPVLTTAPILITLNGGHLITAHASSPVVRLWSMTDGEPGLTLDTAKQLYRLSLSADGKRLLVGSSKGEAAVWQLDRGELLLELGPATGNPVAGALSPAGRQAIKGGFGTEAQLWDIAAATATRLPIPGAPALLRDACFDSSGQHLLMSTVDRRVVICSASGDVVAIHGPLRYLMDRVEFADHDRLAVATSRSGELRAWSIETGAQVTALHLTSATSLVLGPTGEKLLMLGDDGQITLIAARQPRPVSVVNRGAARSRWLLNPRCELLALGDNQRRIQVVQSTTGELVSSGDVHHDQARPLAWHPDGKLLLSGGASGEVVLSDMQTGEVKGRWRDGSKHEVTTARFDPAGKYLLLGTWDGTLILLTADLATEMWIRDAALPDRSIPGISRFVADIQLLPDNRFVIRVVGSSYVLICDLQGNLQPRPPPDVARGTSSMVSALSVQPGSSRFATAYNNGLVALWSADQAASLASYQAHRREILFVQFSPGGNLLVSGGRDRRLSLYDLRNGSLQSLAGQASWPTCAAFSQDEHRLFTGGFDGQVKVWDAVHGREVLSLPATGAAVECLGLTPDGRSLISGDENGAARRFETAPW